MAVPGALFCGSVIHRAVQPGFSRAAAVRKFGAVAVRSCRGSPVRWHFRQGAAGEEKIARAIRLSCSVSGSAGDGIHGEGSPDNASKNRTSVPISRGEKWNVGMRAPR